MKKSIVIYATVSTRSAKNLATAINERSYGLCEARVVNPFKVSPRIKRNDVIFSYGCSSDNKSDYDNLRFNRSQAVMNCISKSRTFGILKRNGIPTVDNVTSWNDVPKKWTTIVTRDTVDGNKAIGLNYCEQHELVNYKHCQLFTEYFPHKYEYRIVVFKGKIVGRYYKHPENGDWILNIQPSRGFADMDKVCIKAAAVLGIDYVGFDVVANTKQDFRILEANSGPILTNEAESAIVSYLMNLGD